MIYGSTTLATDLRPNGWRVKIMKSVFFFIPRANPDSEKYFPEVKKWALELDDAGTVIREVGLNESGLPIFRSPAAGNLGFWTDEDKKFRKEEIVYMSAHEFESLWKDVQK